jgi:hypothetical protein
MFVVMFNAWRSEDTLTLPGQSQIARSNKADFCFVFYDQKEIRQSDATFTRRTRAL